MYNSSPVSQRVRSFLSAQRHITSSNSVHWSPSMAQVSLPLLQHVSNSLVHYPPETSFTPFATCRMATCSRLKGRGSRCPKAPWVRLLQPLQAWACGQAWAYSWQATAPPSWTRTSRSTRCRPLEASSSRRSPRCAPVLCHPSGIVLSDTRQIVPTNLEYYYLRVPSCRPPPGLA